LEIEVEEIVSEPTKLVVGSDSVFQSFAVIDVHAGDSSEPPIVEELKMLDFLKS